MKQSFAAAKYVLTNVLVLHPHPSARIPLSVDAFSSYFGTVLHQELAGSWAPGCFWENDCFWKKNYMQLYWMSSYMKFNSCGGAKTSWYFLKNYSLISTDALEVGFLFSLTIINVGLSLTIINEGSSLTIVNEGSSLTIVSEVLSLMIVKKGPSLTIVNATIGLKNDRFSKRSFF